MRTRTFPGLGFDPAPGSVADTEAVLARLERVSATVDGSAHGLRRATRAGAWRGAAATTFRSEAGRLTDGLADLVAAVRSAARAVSTWQSRMVTNQREADELEAAAARLRAASADDPAAAAELSRVLDRAGRLQARHLRQASMAAAAVRSGAVSAWPAEPAGWQAGRVSRWTGDLATGLQTMVAWLPGREGGFGGSPGVVELPGDGIGVGGRPEPGDPAGLAGRPGLVGPAGLDGLPGRLGGPGWVGPAVLPGPGVPVRPLEPAGTAPGGWLDTGPAPAVRTPLQRITAHRLPETAGNQQAVHHSEPPARTVDRVVDRTAGRAHVRTSGEAVPPARDHADGRKDVAPIRGRGGEAHGSGRLGGHAALQAPAGPSGPAGPDHPPGQQVATGGGTAAVTGAPPPQPAPHTPPDLDRPSGQTVEQAATQPAPVEHRPAAPAPAGPGEPAGSPGSGGEGQGQRADGRGPDAGRALEPGRATGADPRPTTPANPGQPAHAPAKTRDTDLAAVLLGPVTDEPTAGGSRPGAVRVFLLSRPGTRPVLAILQPGGEPIFVAGLTRCASALSACAAPIPAATAPDVY